MITCALLLLLAAPPSPVDEAERLAGEATRAAALRPAEAVALARRALAVTAEFDPIAFVHAGRKGEVVEDTFQAARTSYRQHRARLYEAAGIALAAAGRNEAAARHLRRALVLEPTSARASSLARVLLGLGRGREALELLESPAAGVPNAESIPLFEQAADAAGLPSAQVEIDRARLGALAGGKIEVREGPLKIPADTRLSTGGPLRLDAAPIVFYMAAASCRNCSEDLEAVARSVPAGTRVAVVPESADRDIALRQVLQLYHYAWPITLGAGIAPALHLEPGSLLVVGRGGWLPVMVKAPFATTLGPVAALLARNDVPETVPRRAWNLRPPDRTKFTPPALLPEGLAPGEDDPAPPEFTAAVEAYRAKRFAEALRGFEALGARDDGWLL
ncbi:MAG TPA: tetratricopeptide repeat protein, partial [Vicinamibacteria bacterium]|nr:tetratricopeptide repeat protein [Vicinamibacteria bacterium]